jgi:hypothetical protein
MSVHTSRLALATIIRERGLLVERERACALAVDLAADPDKSLAAAAHSIIAVQDAPRRYTDYVGTSVIATCVRAGQGAAFLEALTTGAKADGSAAAAALFTGFPLSDIPDEHAFIRMLQLNEIIFNQCVWLLEQQSADTALASVAQLLAGPALESLRRLTMIVSPEGFAAFAAVTGNISALDSEAYALLEAQLQEPHPDRLASQLYSRHPRARALAESGHSIVAIARAGGSPALREALASAATALRGWKACHLATVLKTLGPLARRHENVQELAHDLTRSAFSHGVA